MKKIILISALLLALNVSAQTLHLYGGVSHNIYLGCLNCSKHDSNLIWNKYGDYGDKYSSTSIWNKYGSYGDKYSDGSPWNNYANNPPVVVDKSGNFYGYLTVNRYKDKRANFSLAIILYENHESIREDVSEWYEKIFE